jgi:hypothetical protein
MRQSTLTHAKRTNPMTNAGLGTHARRAARRAPVWTAYARLLLRKSTAAAALLALGVAACNTSDLLKVEDPDVPGSSSLNGLSGLPVLLAGAVGDFKIAYQGTGNCCSPGGMVVGSGLFGDELGSGDTFPDRQELDQRSVQLTDGVNGSLFANLQRARASADRVAARYADLAPDSSGRVLVLALSGFATVIIGENYCSGVPFGSIDESGSTITYGEPLPTSAIWALAIAKFDSATALATDSLATLAAIGRGRALLDSGMYDEAAAAVANVPAGFTYNIESSANSTDQNNGVWAAINNSNWLYVTDRKGTNGLPYRSANDPRVPWQDMHVPSYDGITPAYAQLKYPSRTAPVPLVTSAEARLIEAEAALHHSDDDTFLNKLNAARAEFPGVAPLTAADIPATLDGKVDLLFRERGFSLWLTAHRVGDMRRLIRQYGRDPETVFPTGNWFKGPPSNPSSVTPYGQDVTLPVPQTEDNNPNFHGCINRSA